jgi:hypothetical protein
MTAGRRCCAACRSPSVAANTRNIAAANSKQAGNLCAQKADPNHNRNQESEGAGGTVAQKSFPAGEEHTGEQS